MEEIKLRTEDELLRPEYNYYIYFKIEPTEQDVSKIKDIILQEKNNWIRGETPIQKRYKELFPDVEQVMLKDMGFNPATNSYSKSGARATELVNAKRIKFEEAVRLITSMAVGRGRLYKSELNKIVRSGKEWFAIEELEKEVNALLIQGKGIQYIDDTKSVIDFNTYEKFGDSLIVAKKTTLYDAIDGKPDDSAENLYKCASAAYSNLKVKTSAEGTALKNIFGEAKKIFKTEESKQKYDEYLAIKKEVWDELKLRMDNNMKEIVLDEYLQYLKRIETAFGIKETEAELRLAAGLKYFKIELTFDEKALRDEDGNSKVEYCPYPECGKPYVVFKGIKFCPRCNQPLEISCWNCGSKMLYKDKVCPACKSTLKSETLFYEKIEDVKKILNIPTSSNKELRSALLNLKNTMPNYQDNKNSLAYKEIEKYEKLVDKKIKEEETTGTSYKRDTEKIQKQIALKNYWQASALAAEVKKNYPTYHTDYTDGLVRDIEKALGLARTQVQQAKTYVAQNNENQAIACAAKALDVCADYSEARQIIQNYPPKAPSKFKVNVTDSNTVHMEWDRMGSQSSITYTIIRKTGSKPTSITDGDIIDSNLSIGFYEDTSIISAMPYYYAVYAVRYGIASDMAVSNASVQIFCDVSDIRQEVVPGQISVTWNAPRNVKAVEVWKKEGVEAPSRAGNGIGVAVQTQDGFTDNIAGNECGYLILCQYEVNGVKKYSNGIKCVFKKYEQLQKIGDISVLPQSMGKFLLKCSPPESGKLSVVYSKERLLCSVDTVLQTIDFDRLCKNVSVADISYDKDRNMLFTLPQNQILWAYPMVRNEQLFLLSSPVLLSTINGIRNVSFTETNGTVHIRGTLDAGIKNVIVKVGSDRFPAGIEDEGETFSITKERFVAENGATIKLRENTLNYISVFTEIEQNGKKAYTEAIPINNEPIETLRKRVVQYALEYKVSATKEFPVTLKFLADEEIELPRLCLRKGFPCPMDKNSGALVEMIEPVKLKKGLFSKKYTAKQTIMVPPDSQNMRYIVFIDDSRKNVQLKQVKNI